MRHTRVSLHVGEGDSTLGRAPSHRPSGPVGLGAVVCLFAKWSIWRKDLCNSSLEHRRSCRSTIYEYVAGTRHVKYWPTLFPMRVVVYFVTGRNEM